jgi:hypothetical protein
VEILAGTGTICSSNDGDGDDSLTIEETLYTTLQNNGFTTEDTVRGVGGLALGKRDGSINHSRLALGDGLGGSLGERGHDPLCIEQTLIPSATV